MCQSLSDRVQQFGSPPIGFALICSMILLQHQQRTVLQKALNAVEIHLALAGVNMPRITPD